MKIASLLTECRDAGVSIRLEGDVLKLRGTPEAVAAAKVRLKPHKAEIIRHMLGQFCIDDCAADPEPELIDRINNMAWEFMQHDGMTFETAIKTAAEIVVHGTVTECEAAYTNVRELWHRIKSASSGTAQAP